MTTWKDLEKIGTPDEWMKMYVQNQELLIQDDVSEWWKEQYIIADKERNKLKEMLQNIKL